MSTAPANIDTSDTLVEHIVTMPIRNPKGRGRTRRPTAGPFWRRLRRPWPISPSGSGWP